MEIRIRKADGFDLEELMRWREVVLREVFSIPDEEDMTELLAANRAYYHTALERGEHIACFACAGGMTVGCGGVCLYQEMPSPDNPSGKCGYLMNIYTLPALRQRGGGKEIVQTLVQEATRWRAEK
ncbi:MAG: GNAT family N-acetyltransferase, partial [Clostridiales bacterium]|nr:GNAT family N-acetyltransferase [Clostridiales bacterium]